MGKYRKFVITASVILALVWCAAFTLDVFGTFGLCLAAFIFFLATFILAAVRLIGRKEIKYNLIIMGLSVLLGASLILPPRVANRGLHQLTAKRKVLLQELRPVFIQYRKDHGTYPAALEDLVPAYLAQIPPELVNDGRSDSYSKIYYSLQSEEEPTFLFHSARGPDSGVIYDIHKDSFWYEP